MPPKRRNGSGVIYRSCSCDIFVTCLSRDSFNPWQKPPPLVSGSHSTFPRPFEHYQKSCTWLTASKERAKMSNPPPPSFYRVQHNMSYTIWDDAHGFESNGHYHMSSSSWINAQTIQGHLTWSHQPPEPSAFISVFDNLGSYLRRAIVSLPKLWLICYQEMHSDELNSTDSDGTEACLSPRLHPWIYRNALCLLSSVWVEGRMLRGR